MPAIGAPEILIILVIVVVLFGVGRIGKIGGELGKGIKEFRSALKDGEEDKAGDKTAATSPPPTKTEDAKP